jgi:hypothetical protein
MLVALTNSQPLPLQLVCRDCLLADRRGQPRWQQGRLRCGRRIRPVTTHLPEQFECRMGFRIVDIQ